jgi:uncharacterized LabA/DUF88 family protein
MAMGRRSKKPEVYAFIDSQNLNLGIQRMGWKMDWRRFRQFLRDKYNVTQAYMFIGYMSENEALYEHMHELGYLIVLKPTVDVAAHNQAAEARQAEAAGTAPSAKPPEEKEKEKSVVKGNIDADLVLHAMKELPNYSKAIIVSGDGDFFGLVEYLASQNKLDHILTPNWQYSSLLKPFESYIVRLDQLRRELAYHDRKKK